MLRLKFHRELAAECLGTFCLVFAGTGAIVINHVTGGAIGHAGIALTFGLIVLAMIYTFGDISGAHLNPAVTIAFVAAKRFPAVRAIPYILSQLVGALLASFLVKLLFTSRYGLGETVPFSSFGQAFALEVILTTMLMLVILSVSTGAKEKGITAGIAIGGVITLEALFAGPISGASMNPARSLAPAVVGGNLSALWAYIAAPILGALIAVPLCCLVRGNGCCQSPLNETRTTENP